MTKAKWFTSARDDVAKPPPGSDLKILVFDIETAPEANFTWSRFKTNIVGTLRPDYMLSFVYTWYGSDEAHYVGQNQNPQYRPDKPASKPVQPNQDRWVVSRLWHLIDMADVVVAHNADGFDIPYAQGRFEYYELGPTSQFASIDTLATSKRHFKYPSRSLKELTTRLLDETKIQNMGFDVWRGCMDGEEWAWKRMEEYNLQDVLILVKLFVRLIPWNQRRKKLPAPNANYYTAGRPTICPMVGCGGKNLQIRKHLPPTTAGMIYRQFQCFKETKAGVKVGCGAYFSANYAERNETPPKDRVKP